MPVAGGIPFSAHARSAIFRGRVSNWAAATTGVHVAVGNGCNGALAADGTAVVTLEQWERGGGCLAIGPLIDSALIDKS